MGNREKIKKAKKGSIVTIEEEVEFPSSSLDYFAKLTDYGRNKNCILFESAEIFPRYGEITVGISNPCLKIKGKGADFEIKALNDLGKKFIKFLQGDFNFCDKAIYEEDSIIGKLRPLRKIVDEEGRLNLKTHIDIIRKIAFKFKPDVEMTMPNCGLFGFISYDFIDQFEDLPKDQKDVLNEPDYELFYADNLFLIDHKSNTAKIFSNALIMDDDREDTYKQCLKKIDYMKKCILRNIPKKRKFKLKKQIVETDSSEEDYANIVDELKKHILEGDIFQVVHSRTTISNFNAEPLDIYKKLKSLNPSPYMFYINDDNGILLGASPEMSLKVQGAKEKVVEIRPIAGTKPRGINNGNIDRDLDSRYETELKIDPKEIAEHTMLVDLARNDIARICKPGTRYVSESMIIEKYSHVQHLVSNVKGILRPGLDALHAYLTSMNMGTLTGAPKVEAMKLIRKVEKSKRGSYGGAVCHITPNGDLDSAIIIRSMKIKNGKSYIRAGAGIVYDSDPKSEFDETERKAQACLNAIKMAGGLK